MSHNATVKLHNQYSQLQLLNFELETSKIAAELLASGLKPVDRLEFIEKFTKKFIVNWDCGKKKFIKFNPD